MGGRPRSRCADGGGREGARNNNVDCLEVLTGPNELRPRTKAGAWMGGAAASDFPGGGADLVRKFRPLTAFSGLLVCLG